MFSSDVATVLNPELNQKKILPKQLIEISVRDLHNDMIKPYDNGGLESVINSATHKFLISDTTLT